MKKSTEDEIRKLKREHKRVVRELTQHYQDIREFSFITSHILRAPVANLVGIVELLDDTNVKDEQTKKLLRFIGDSARRLDEIMKDLAEILSVKECTHVVKSNVLLGDIWQKTLCHFGDEISKIDPVMDVDFKEAPSVCANPDYLQCIFINLLSNALKFRSPKRQLTISLKSWAENGKVAMSFTDNGRGFDTSGNADKVFGLYKRFHADVEGKGLGLFMVKTLVQTMGGQIKVRSLQDIGTSFKISFTGL